MSPDQKREIIATMPVGSSVEWVGNRGSLVAIGTVEAIHGNTMMTLRVTTAAVGHIMPGALVRVALWSGDSSRVRPSPKLTPKVEPVAVAPTPEPVAAPEPAVEPAPVESVDACEEVLP